MHANLFLLLGDAVMIYTLCMCKEGIRELFRQMNIKMCLYTQLGNIFRNFLAKFSQIYQQTFQ